MVQASPARARRVPTRPAARAASNARPVRPATCASTATAYATPPVVPTAVAPTARGMPARARPAATTPVASVACGVWTARAAPLARTANASARAVDRSAEPAKSVAATSACRISAAGSTRNAAAPTSVATGLSVFPRLARVNSNARSRWNAACSSGTTIGSASGNRPSVDPTSVAGRLPAILMPSAAATNAAARSATRSVATRTSNAWPMRASVHWPTAAATDAVVPDRRVTPRRSAASREGSRLRTGSFRNLRTV